jgi:hypothetical protein
LSGSSGAAAAVVSGLDDAQTVTVAFIFELAATRGAPVEVGQFIRTAAPAILATLLELQRTLTRRA